MLKINPVSWQWLRWKSVPSAPEGIPPALGSTVAFRSRTLIPNAPQRNKRQPPAKTVNSLVGLLEGYQKQIINRLDNYNNFIIVNKEYMDHWGQ